MTYITTSRGCFESSRSSRAASLKRRAAVISMAVALAVPCLVAPASSIAGTGQDAGQEQADQQAESRRHYVAGIQAYQTGDFATARTELAVSTLKRP